MVLGASKATKRTLSNSPKNKGQGSPRSTVRDLRHCSRFQSCRKNLPRLMLRCNKNSAAIDEFIAKIQNAIATLVKYQHPADHRTTVLDTGRQLSACMVSTGAVRQYTAEAVIKNSDRFPKVPTQRQDRYPCGYFSGSSQSLYRHSHEIESAIGTFSRAPFHRSSVLLC